MVKLTEVEDEHFSEKPATTKDDALFADDDDDYTDTDSEISDIEDNTVLEDNESLTDRIIALKDIIPPKTRATIANISNQIYNVSSTGVGYGGKGLWVIATSMLLLGIPYALALSQEQEFMEEEKRQSMMQEGVSGLMSVDENNAEAKSAL